MQKALQHDVLRMLATTLVFCFFFETTKHISALVRVNPFAEDPYDAIGSFAVQFALFVALLSMMRAFRTGPVGPDTRARRLIARGNLLCIAAVMLTLLGDCVALVRHMGMWRHSAAGRDLLLLTSGLWIWSFVVLWLWSRMVRQLQLPAEAAHWLRRSLPLGTLAMVILILAVYPEGVRETIPGALLTVVVGMTLLFVPLRVFASMIPTDPRESDADAVDDIVRFGRTLAPRHSFKAVEDPPGIGQAARFTTKRVGWLRRNRWTFTLMVGIAIGAFLGEQELAGSQAPYRQLLTVGAVFIGLESAAILMGAALLSRPLRLLGVPSSKAATVALRAP